MNYQILFCDLDGTLLRSDKALAPATRAALERAVRQGVEFVPATGRFFSGMPAVVRELPFLRYAVLMNGALVYDRLEDRALRRAELAPETAVRIMERLQDFSGTLDCYMEDSQGWMEARYLQELEHWILDPPPGRSSAPPAGPWRICPATSAAGEGRCRRSRATSGIPPSSGRC